MKKLLLILICLFVSLEVQSSDDLTGKKLLCDNSEKGFLKKIRGEVFDLIGIEFINSKEIQYHKLKVNFRNLTKDDLINHLGIYETTSDDIIIDLLGLYDKQMGNYLIVNVNHFFINRRNLKLFRNPLILGVYKCKIKSGNYTKMFEKKYNKLTKKLEKLKKKREEEIKDELKI